MSIVQSPRAVVLGLAKDCEQTLQGNFGSIVSFLQGWNIEWVLLESNSTDGTRNRLTELANKMPNLSLLGEPANIRESMDRPEQMAIRRNSLLDHMRTNLTDSPEAIIVVDLDIPLQLEGNIDFFRNNLNERIVTLAHQSPYYDIWALRYSDQEHDCFKQVEIRINRGENPFLVYHEEIFSHQRIIGQISEPIPVSSAFGGFAIYPNFSDIPVNYSASQGCEHVAFNLALAGYGFRMSIDPKLKTGPVTDHNKFARLPWRWAILLMAQLYTPFARKIFQLLRNYS